MFSMLSLIILAAPFSLFSIKSLYAGVNISLLKLLASNSPNFKQELRRLAAPKIKSFNLLIFVPNETCLLSFKALLFPILSVFAFAFLNF